jgi:hypothetical protein
MLDTVVQFVRNALCCCKDLHLFANTKLQDPTHTAEYYNFPPPLDKTTPLELLISTTQLYACASTTLSGYRLIMESGYGKLRRISQLMHIHESQSKHSLADKLVMSSLLEAQAAARKSMFIGFNVISIGISFFWLFANSLHVTETDWIGGVFGLIQALTIMEACLVPLLYYMLQDGYSLLSKANRLQALVGKLQSGSVVESDLTVETYQWIVTNGWTPFWTLDYGPVEPLPDQVTETKSVNEEVQKLSTTLNAITSKKKDMSTVLTNAAARLESEVSMLRMEGYREFLYFLINWIAFYGYLLGIIVYYYDEDEFTPTHVWHLKAGMKNEDADWYGNFAGDLMWTIEPIIILGSPFLLTWLKPTSIKVKKD